MARKSRYKQNTENNISAKVKILPAWIYARISKENDHAEDSIDNQISFCKDYIHAQNNLIFEDIFTDLGYSGGNFERPGYADMIAGILLGTIKCVVVKDLSRLGRSYIDVGELVFDTFVQHKIRFISINDNYDSFADGANRKKLHLMFRNIMNQAYRLDLSRKIKSTLILKKKRGEPLGLPPYGYLLSEDKKRLEIDGEAAEIVKMIFAMRLQGKGVYSIANYLNQNDIPSPQHHRHQLSGATQEKLSERIIWTGNSVSRILCNDTYIGSLIQGKYAYNGIRYTRVPKGDWINKENTHSAIISKDQFDAVARMIQKSVIKYKQKNRGAVEENRYLGKIFCSRCGKSVMRSENRQSVISSFYYSCRNCSNELKQKNGLKKASNLSLAKLDIIVMEILSKCMDLLPQVENSIEALSKSDLFRQKRAKIARNRTNYEMTMSDYETLLVAAYTHHLTGLLDIEEYKFARDKFTSDKINAETRLAQLTIEQAKYDINHIKNNLWLIQYGKFRNCSTPTKEMIQTLIKRITITPLSNEVHIELNFMDCFEELRKIIQECKV
jgi:DNA invertase Pin-like site-specific DNA recombinase